MRHILTFISFLLLFSCEFFHQKEENGKNPIARAGDLMLYEEDLSNLIPRNISSSDSTKLAEKFVNDWIKKQLIMFKAQEELALDEEEIDRKVVNYRYALIVHEFEKLYVNSHLDMNVSQEEVEAYYSERPDNFILKQNIIRCLFVQIPKNAPQIQQLRRNVRSYPNTNKDDIGQYALQYAMKTFLEDSIWIEFDEVIAGTPLDGMSNKIRFLERTSFSETSDDHFIYFLRILDYKISDQAAPLEFIREDIENIIISKRKLALKKELENAIYDEARKNKDFEVFRD